MKLFSMSLLIEFDQYQRFKTSILESCANHGGTLPANKPKRKAEGVGNFRRYPTSDNLIAFKRAKALARRIRRQCQRES
ncbi:hypothetical protein TNCV_2986681 [Trichonephila clavipes]|nr:hypothetical protein TNCV_2986681 [Trichonephila clavipes]